MYMYGGCCSSWVLRMQAEVDNEEGSTIHIQNVWELTQHKNYKTDFKQVSASKRQKNRSVKRFISVPSTALYGAGN